jgi:hypothetical protein
MMMVMYVDPETLKRGIVHVLYNFGERHRSLDDGRKYHRVIQALPKKVVALHYCYNNNKVLAALTGFQLLVFNDSRRFRLRKHTGDLAHIHFELQTFGIPIQESPMQENDVWSTEKHLQWIQQQEQWEREADTRMKSDSSDIRSALILVPRNFDVLFGKDKAALSHPGNLRFHLIVEMHQNLYEAVGRREKTKVADRVLQIIHDSNGRFLKRGKLGWEEVDRASARDKVSHYFRRLRDTRNEQNSNSTYSK